MNKNILSKTADFLGRNIAELYLTMILVGIILSFVMILSTIYNYQCGYEDGRRDVIELIREDSRIMMK